MSRSWPLLLIRLMPHVGDAAGSKSKPLADQISRASLITAFLWCFCALALVLWTQYAMYFAVSGAGLLALVGPIAAAVLTSALAFVYMGRLLWRRLGGFTGDGLGATQQLCELAFYLGWALAL